MDNGYLFNRVVLILRENNEDIEEYVNNCRLERLAVELYLYGALPTEDIAPVSLADNILRNMDALDSDDNIRILCITDNQEVVLRVQEEGLAVLGYYSRSTGQEYLSLRYVVESLSQVEDDYLNMVYMRAHGIPLTIAETQRTVIREMTASDLPAMYELYSDEAVAEWVEPLYEYEKELEFTREYIDKMYGFYGYGLWLVFDRATGELIGRAGISHRCIDGEECCELGYIIKGSRQRQGIGREVSTAVMDYAARQLEIDRLWLCAAYDNTASLALAGRLGFQLYGECEQNGKRYYLYNKSLR